MDRIFQYSCIFLFIGFFSACTTDFELEGEWKDIPIVYGFISRMDTAHYIRVEKAFLEPGGNALEIAQNPDSLYYKNVSVQIERINSGAVFNLERVDGNLEGYPREDGIFATSPNYLYKIKASEIKLNNEEPIRLIINRGDDKDLITAETVILSDMTTSSTSPPNPINMSYERQIRFAWNADFSTRLFDVRLFIHIQESSLDDPNRFEERTLEWILATNLRRSEDDTERVNIRIQGEEFYRFLASNLDNTTSQNRFFLGMDMQITGVGEELQEFLDIAGSNRGITSFQSIPVYTNLSEGIGLFSSRTKVTRRDIGINAVSLDSLRNGIHTKDLNFQ